MADVSNLLFRESQLEGINFAAPLLDWLSVRIPLAKEARDRRLAAIDPKVRSDYYKYLSDSLKRVQSQGSDVIRSATGTQQNLSSESRGAMALEGAYRSAAASERSAATRAAADLTLEKWRQSFQLSNSATIKTDEQDQVRAAAKLAQQAFEAAPGDYATKLANATEQLASSSEALVKSQDTNHGGAIAYAVANELESIAKPANDEERRLLNAAQTSLHQRFGVPILTDPEGRPVPATLIRARGAEGSTAIAEDGQGSFFIGPSAPRARPSGGGSQAGVPAPAAAAPTLLPGEAPAFVPVSAEQQEAAEAGEVIEDQRAMEGVPEGGTPIAGADGMMYVQLSTGDYIVHPASLYAGNVPVLQQTRRDESGFQQMVIDDLARQREREDEIRAKGEDRIGLDLFDTRPNDLTVSAQRFNERIRSMSPERRTAETVRITEYLQSIVPKGRTAPADKRIDAGIEASRKGLEETEALGGASYAAAPLPAETAARRMREARPTIDALNEAWSQMEYEIKSQNLTDKDPAAREARGRWYAAFGEATKGMAPDTQRAMLNELSVSDKVRAALTTMLDAKQAPTATARAMDRAQADSMANLVDDTATAIAGALKGDIAPTARQQGGSEFEALAEGGMQEFANAMARMRQSAKGAPDRERILGIEDAAEAKGPEWGAASLSEKVTTPRKDDYTGLAVEPTATGGRAHVGGGIFKENADMMLSSGPEIEGATLPPRSHAFVDLPGAVQERTRLRDEYTKLIGDEDEEARALYVEQGMRKFAKKAKEPADAAQP